MNIYIIIIFHVFTQIEFIINIISQQTSIGEIFPSVMFIYSFYQKEILGNNVSPPLGYTAYTNIILIEEKKRKKRNLFLNQKVLCDYTACWINA